MVWRIIFYTTGLTPLDQFAICLILGYLINLKRLGISSGWGLLLFVGRFGDVAMILFLTKSKLTRFCRSSSGEHTGFGSGLSCNVMQGFLYRPRNSRISEISRLLVGPGILLVPPKIFGILKLCALKIGNLYYSRG